jgi:hypothetical protein
MPPEFQPPEKYSTGTEPLRRRAAWRSVRLMVRGAVAALGALLLTAACQVPGTSPTCNTSIDWVNFIQVGSMQYVAGLQAPTILQEADLGAVYARVKFKLSGNVCDPSYRVKDGDAAFLDPGTPIYQVKGQPPTKQLAARFNGQMVVYNAMTP